MNETVQDLIDNGYAEDETLVAATADGKYLCVNGDIVTLSDGENKIFSDSVDRLEAVKVSGLFAKTVCFTRGGEAYALKLKGGKTVADYFKQLTF